MMPGLLDISLPTSTSPFRSLSKHKCYVLVIVIIHSHHLYLQEMNQYWTMSSKDVILQKAVQNPETYHSDFLSGPIDNDMALATCFDWKSSWCYHNNCNNNIYKGLKEKESNIIKNNQINFEHLLMEKFHLF